MNSDSDGGPGSKSFYQDPTDKWVQVIDTPSTHRERPATARPPPPPPLTPRPVRTAGAVGLVWPGRRGCHIRHQRNGLLAACWDRDHPGQGRGRRGRGCCGRGRGISCRHPRARGVRLLRRHGPGAAAALFAAFGAQRVLIATPPRPHPWFWRWPRGTFRRRTWRTSGLRSPSSSK